MQRITWARVYKDGKKSLSRLSGSANWMKLGETLLPQKVKSIVAADTDLTDTTMEKLVAALGKEPETIPLYFEEPKPDQDQSQESAQEVKDIGYTVLSMCIKQDRNANWAEIVGRYSAVRRLPFVETAIALKELAKKNGGLFYYDERCSPVKWMPARSLRNMTDIEEEWDILISQQRKPIH